MVAGLVCSMQVGKHCMLLTVKCIAHSFEPAHHVCVGCCRRYFFVDMNDEAIEALSEQVKLLRQAYSLVASSPPQHK